MPTKIKITKSGNHLAIMRVAEELNVPEALVEKIAMSQSLFIRKTIKTGLFETITLAYLGKVRARHRKVQMINERRGMI